MSGSNRYKHYNHSHIIYYGLTNGSDKNMMIGKIYLQAVPRWIEKI